MFCLFVFGPMHFSPEVVVAYLAVSISVISTLTIQRTFRTVTSKYVFTFDYLITTSFRFKKTGYYMNVKFPIINASLPLSTCFRSRIELADIWIILMKSLWSVKKNHSIVFEIISWLLGYLKQWFYILMLWCFCLWQCFSCSRQYLGCIRKCNCVRKCIELGSQTFHDWFVNV